MASVNPYESPTIPAELLEPEWPAAGVFRDGQFLVLHHTSLLPPICLKTALPAETELPADLVGGMPNDDSVQATRRKWYGDKVYAISVPMSHQALRRAAWIQRVGLIVAAAALVLIGLTVLLQAELSNRGLAEAAPIACVVVLIFSIALLTESRHQLRLECVARGYFWISNAPKKYLRELPPWPVPRPSWWRRAFFGPAGVSGPQKKEGES